MPLKSFLFVPLKKTYKVIFQAGFWQRMSEIFNALAFFLKKRTNLPVEHYMILFREHACVMIQIQTLGKLDFHLEIYHKEKSLKN